MSTTLSAPRRRPPRSRRIATYEDAEGTRHELVMLPGAARSVLVIDRGRPGSRDPRLVAALDPDEPAENAELVAALYLSDPTGRHCRALEPEDLSPATTTHRDQRGQVVDREHRRRATDHQHGRMLDHEQRLADTRQHGYRLERVRGPVRAIEELRWVMHPPDGALGPVEVVSLRRVVGMLESYEPARALSVEAVARHVRDHTISIVTLRAEIGRLAASRVVLNRGLREVVLRIAERDGLSMSQIAARCGRTKRDARGRVSGETSWLGRRLGLLPDGGSAHPTPWVHSDVLALIARRGLGVSPREVELA